MTSNRVDLRRWLRARASAATLSALAVWSCATHGVKAVPQPPGPSPLSSARAIELWNQAGQALTLPEADELVATLREGPDPEVRLAAAWRLGHGTFEGEKPWAYDEDPAIDQSTTPTYPQEALDRRIEGIVTVEFLIGEQGAVAHAEIRESIPALDAAALACVRQWRFRPARFKGKPVVSLAQAPVTFRIFKRR